MRRRYAGLSGDYTSKLQQVKATLVVPTPVGIIREPFSLNSESLVKLKMLLEEAFQYRHPPRELLIKIRKELVKVKNELSEKAFDIMMRKFGA
jgi:hypothetical protein